MNWFKQAKIHLRHLSHWKDTTFNVIVNGKDRYTFYGVDMDLGDTLAWQIKNQPWKHGSIFNLLKKRYSRPDLHKQPEPVKEEPVKEPPVQRGLFDELV